MDTRPSTRSESFASTTTVSTNDSNSVNTNPGRTSPVSSKKKGFSRKLFNVFSSRSGSISSPVVSSHNEHSSSNPQTPSAGETHITLPRASVPTTKESMKPIRSVVNKFYVLIKIIFKKTKTSYL